jgi:hypothetical protein
MCSWSPPRIAFSFSFIWRDGCACLPVLPASGFGRSVFRGPAAWRKSARCDAAERPSRPSVRDLAWERRAEPARLFRRLDGGVPRFQPRGPLKRPWQVHSGSAPRKCHGNRLLRTASRVLTPAHVMNRLAHEFSGSCRWRLAAAQLPSGWRTRSSFRHSASLSRNFLPFLEI